MSPVVTFDDHKDSQESEDEKSRMHIAAKIFIHGIVVVYFSYATYNYITTREYLTFIEIYRNHGHQSFRRQMHSRLWFDPLFSVWNAAACDGFNVPGINLFQIIKTTLWWSDLWLCRTTN